MPLLHDNTKSMNATRNSETVSPIFICILILSTEGNNHTDSVLQSQDCVARAINARKAFLKKEAKRQCDSEHPQFKADLLRQHITAQQTYLNTYKQQLHAEDVRDLEEKIARKEQLHAKYLKQLSDVRNKTDSKEETN